MSINKEENEYLLSKQIILFAKSHWKMSENQSSFSLEEVQNKLLKLRLEEHYTNPTSGKNWEQIKHKYKK